MNCPVCNKQVEQGSNFCPNCGFNFCINKPYHYQAPDTGTKILKWMLISITGLFILAIIGIGIVTYNIATQTVKETNNSSGLTMLQAGEISAEINTKSLKMKEIITPNTAIATIADKQFSSGEFFYGSTDVLYIAPENERLFEGQIINIPDGKKLVQVGTFKKYRETLAAVEIK
ncbi:zinc-ribbon domain-containing protein [Anaerovibrio sp.]|uniref:zinc-ribbon domain-containing protein n=1 Tax=Anaerovibrio sp. TaxID=1872532 RepID=UPI00388EB11C